jgi:hypothetical protein
MDGIPSLCTGAVCQKSIPVSKAIFSPVVSFDRASSTSNEPKGGCCDLITMVAVCGYELPMYSDLEDQERRNVSKEPKEKYSKCQIMYTWRSRLFVEPSPFTSIIFQNRYN